jgi:hypothetical protein
MNADGGNPRGLVADIRPGRSMRVCRGTVLRDAFLLTNLQ